LYTIHVTYHLKSLKHEAKSLFCFVFLGAMIDTISFGFLLFLGFSSLSLIYENMKARRILFFFFGPNKRQSRKLLVLRKIVRKSKEQEKQEKADEIGKVGAGKLEGSLQSKQTHRRRNKITRKKSGGYHCMRWKAALILQSKAKSFRRCSRCSRCSRFVVELGRPSWSRYSFSSESKVVYRVGVLSSSKAHQGFIIPFSF
jgi:hypothetical protein